MASAVRDSDPELLALKRIERALGTLTDAQAARVLRYAWERSTERLGLGLAARQPETKGEAA